MMQQKQVKEYRLLGQTENDRFFHNSDANGRHRAQDQHFNDSDSDDSSITYKTKPCCVSSLILITVIFIFAGTSAIIVSFWYSHEFHAALDSYWPNHPNFVTPTGVAHGNLTVTEKEGNSNTNNTNNGTESGEGDGGSSGSGETSYSGESTSSYEDLNSTDVTTGPAGQGQGHNGTDSEWETGEINERNVGAKFAEAMRKFEKQMEKVSGIHQAELVIPLFMLVTLMSTLALISFCCCLMSKQREKRQRKLLGKFITDLQTGDQKTVLLGNDSDY